MNLNPYLNFRDQCEAAFTFYAKVLGGKIDGILHNGESPMRDHVPKERHHLVMHAQLSIGTQIIMGADMPPDCYKGAGSIALTLNYDEPDEAERIFHALAEGGTINMPIGPTFWAQRFGALTDKFGTPWLINGGFIPMGEK